VQVEGRGEREIARIASVQRGLVARGQLTAAGIGRGAIAHRLRTGRLHRVHRGVYLVGHAAKGPLAEEMAAILYLRGDAVLSYWTAAAMWGLVDSRPRDVTVTIVGRDLRSRRGLRLCRVSVLDARDVRMRAGLPVTSAARTVVGLAAHAPGDRLERVLAEGRIHGLISDDELRAAVGRAAGRKGSGRALALLSAEGAPAFTRSEAERRLLRLVRDSALPRPLVNQKLAGHEVDFVWPAHRLVAEVDGHRFHSGRAAFERDRRRDQVLTAAGYRVIRVTWRQLAEEPLAVVARLAQSLARPAA
jgi:very-short-patch-repair endonuclease